jgi:hypothetical protein
MSAIEKGLIELGHPVERGWGVSETQRVLTQL